jgi:fructokinase
MKYWGIDLGGTKTEIVVIEDGRPILRKRIPTNSHQGYDSLLESLKHLVSDAVQIVGSQPDSVGVATPGSSNPRTGLIRNSNTTCLNGRPLATDLRAVLGVDVFTANDANCFALAESRWGAGTDFATNGTVIGLILGTGVGSGIVVDGKLLNGANGNAGEWGHNQLEPGGAECYCGRRGCVETVISGPALERYYFELTNTQHTLAEIVEKCGVDEFSTVTIDRLLAKFGEAIAGVINILDPDVIVVGGGVGNIGRIYQEWPSYIMPFLFNGDSSLIETRLKKPVLGDSAGVFGAAALTGRFELRQI